MNSTTDLRKRNLLNILLAIRTNAALTKPEIARRISATQVTAHNLINELVEHRLLLENGSARSNGGRKASLYKLNPDCGYIVAQNISPQGIETGVYDLTLRPLYQRSLCVDTSYTGKMQDTVLSEICAAMQENRLSPEQCLGIGVSVPGRVDPVSRVIQTFVHVPGWQGVDLQRAIETGTGVPAWIENDNNANALAMKWTGIVEEDANAVFVSITTGMGVGILLNGSLLYGSHANAGEIGHTTVELNGPLCSCGNRGCLEIMTSYATILEQARLRLKDEGIRDIRQVIALYKQGNKEICGLIDEVTTYLGIALDHIAKGYDPDIIIVDNLLLRELKETYYMAVEKLFSRNAFVGREKLKILVNQREDIDMIGAAALVEERLFHVTENNRLLERLGY